MLPRLASVYIHDTEHATSNRKHFYSSLRESLLKRLALLLEENNNLVKSFVSLRNILQRSGLPDDVKLVIHPHEKTIPAHVRKYNVPEASEVAALIVGEQHGKLDIVMKRCSEFDENRFKKLELINLGHLMYDPLGYPLLFSYGKEGWHCALKHKDSKGNSKKFSRMKFYSRLLIERTCDFNFLIYSGRLFQQHLCEMLVKVDSGRLSWLRYNQSKLRASECTHICDLLADAANHNNEINQ